MGPERHCLQIDHQTPFHYHYLRVGCYVGTMEYMEYTESPRDPTGRLVVSLLIHYQ